MSDFLTWLAGLDQASLAELLRRRPDVLRGSPAPDLAAVESRLGQQHSLADALLRQPQPALDVLRALIMTGGATSVARLAAALDDGHPGDGVDHLQRWLAALQADGLAWLEGGDAAPIARTAPMVDAVLPVPADWGPPVRTLLEGMSKAALHPTLDAWGIPRPTTKTATVAALLEAFGDPVRLAAQLERLTPVQRRLLARGAAPSWSDAFDGQRGYLDHVDAQRAGLAAGVLLSPYAYSPTQGEAPAEVLQALRGRGLPFDPVPPPVPTVPVTRAAVERESTAALVQVDEAVLAVLDHVRARPVKQLQKGGIGAQEVTRLAKTTTVDATTVRLVLDAACEADLLAADGRLLTWGERTAAWRDLDAGHRLAALLEAWLRTPRAPTQTHEAGARPLAVAAPERTCYACADGRRAVLEAWAALDGAPQEADLAARVAWERPFAHLAHRELVAEPDPWDDGWGGRRAPRTPPSTPLIPDERPPDLGTVAQEARLFGLVGGGAPADILRALLRGDHAALVARLDTMLPRATATATFGSDLTAVVVGPPTGELSALLDSCASRESRGAAVMWRFSTASVRRAFDDGATLERLTERLGGVAGSGLPQPLTYLLSDVARRHGLLRVSDARSVVRCDDQALLAEVVVDRKLRALSLRLVAPTVAVSGVGDAETLAALRAAGYLPMPETPALPQGGAPAGPAVTPRDELRAWAAQHGHVLDHGHRLTPTSGRSPLPSMDRRGPDEESATSAAARLVGLTHAAGGQERDRPLEAAIRRANRRLSDDEVQTLARAVGRDGSVRIRYRSATGALTDRVVSDLELAGQQLVGWCHLRADERAFLLSGVLSVSHA